MWVYDVDIYITYHLTPISFPPLEVLYNCEITIAHQLINRVKKQELYSNTIRSTSMLPNHLGLSVGW